LLFFMLISGADALPAFAESAAPAPMPPSGYIPPSDPMAPITVGEREAVGQKSSGDKAAGAIVAGLSSAVFSSSGSRGGKSGKPRTRRDPTRKLDPFEVEHRDSKQVVAARTLWTDQGLLVSAQIDKSPGHGTFQTVFLQSCDGQRLYPQQYEIYKLWSEASLTVSWSKTTTTNGRVTDHQSGGWSDSWTEQFVSISDIPGGETAERPATWQQLGFDRAEGGARELGAYFNVTPQDLTGMGDVGLFVHTTRPGLDPVITTPSSWLVSAQPDGKNRIQAFTSDSQGWAQHCPSVAPLLLADAGVGVTATAEEKGYPHPAGISLYEPRGTGRTTGHIANLTVTNDTSEPFEFRVQPTYIPSSGQYQSYVVPGGSTTIIPPRSSQVVPIEGYCADVRKPPVPEGEALPPPSEWVVPGDAAQPVVIPPRAGALPPGRALIAGTDDALPRAVDLDLEPELAAPLLLAAVAEIERATAELQKNGELQTPFSSNPEREREAVVQQTTWIYAAELAGVPYTREEFTDRLEQQYEQSSGVPIADAPDEAQERVQQGADDFWDSFELVGAEAKVLADGPGATTGDTLPDEAKPAGTTDVPAETAPPPPCTPEKKVSHSDRKVDVEIADSYGTEEDRKTLREGIKNSVESEASAYATSTPPATAYSLWGHDHVGGISSAYAKTVFLEESSQEWVWSTDPLNTSAAGSGIHTLSFKHGRECKSTVAGAALLWLKATSSAFDPLEKNIEVFRALDKVKEVTVKYLADKLPPGLSDAAEAGVDAITDPSSDTYAGASSTATLTVGADKDSQKAENHVVYKRKDKEDKAIIGGGETIKKLFASDVQPGSLTSKLDANAQLKAGATGNGLAKAYLESLYGTILIGVCECPTGSVLDVLTDNGQFIRSEAAQQAVERAKKEMQEAADRIISDLKNGKLKTDEASLKARAEAELRAWAASLGGSRFKPAAEDK
jgi:hypothetical protein